MDPFVGRQVPTASLVEALEAALSGRGSAVLLRGEAGIGKTRLAQEIARLADERGMRVAVGRCHDGEGAPAYWPWIEVARAITPASPEEPGSPFDDDALARDGPPEEEARPAADPAASRQARFRLLDEVTRFVRAQAARAPLLIVLEDLHWADRASLLLLGFLARRLDDARILLVATYRDTDVAADGAAAGTLAEIARDASEVRLGGLARDEVERLVAASGVASDPTSASALAAELHQRTGGNPLFVLELLRLLVAEGAAPEGGTGALPETVKHVLQRRLAALPAAGQAVLRAAAILGDVIDPLLLTALLDDVAPARVEAALGAAVRARLAVAASASEPGAEASAAASFRFAHSLVRDVVLAGIEPAERSRLHGRAAAALHARHLRGEHPPLGALARHFLAAGAGTGASDVLDRAVEFAALAGREALARFAFEEAIAAYELALRALEQRAADASPEEVLRRRAALVERLADARWSAGAQAAARQGYLELADLARRIGSPTALATAAIGFSGRADPDIGPDPEPLALLEEAAAALPDADSKIRALLLANHATRLYFTRERERGIALAREAVAIAERIGDDETRLVALGALHYTLIGPATPDERMPIAERLLGLARKVGSPVHLLWAHTWRALCFLETGDVRSADVEIDAFARLAAAYRDPFFVWEAASYRAMRAILAGDLAAAERLAGEALALGQRAESRNAALVFAIHLMTLRRWQGRLEELVGLGRDFVARHPHLPGFRGVVAGVLSEVGRRDEAALELDLVFANDLEDFPRDGTWLGALAHLALAVAQLGDRARAARVHELLAPFAGRNVVVAFGQGCDGAVSFYRGLLAATLDRHDEAVRDLEDALERHRRMGARPLLARTRHELAAVLVARDEGGDRERAAALVRQAVEAYAELGMPGFRERAALLAERCEAAPERAAERAARDAAGKAVARVPARARGGLSREGDVWRLEWEGREARVRDLKGVHYLAALLRDPGRELHVLDLLLEVEGDDASRRARPSPRERGDAVSRGDGDLAGPDPKARASYRERRLRLLEEIEEAEAANDIGRVERAQQEVEALESALADAFGFGGRGRRTGGASERARKAIYNRLRSAVAAIERVHGPLGRHLGVCVRTGRTCVYRPDRAVDWVVVDRAPSRRR